LIGIILALKFCYFIYELEAYDVVFQIAVSDDPSGQLLYLNLPILTKKLVSRNIKGNIPKVTSKDKS
jgi:hypothetical protein